MQFAKEGELSLVVGEKDEESLSLSFAILELGAPVLDESR